MTFARLGAEVGALVDEKQAAYGDSHGRADRVLAELYPNGIPTTAGALTVVRVVDKLFRLAQAHGQDPHGENPWRDIAGYALLMVARGGGA